MSLACSGVIVSTHSRAEAAAAFGSSSQIIFRKFQHTAARRRLLKGGVAVYIPLTVSTHSRAEAAANVIYDHRLNIN